MGKLAQEANRPLQETISRNLGIIVGLFFLASVLIDLSVYGFEVLVSPAFRLRQVMLFLGLFYLLLALIDHSLVRYLQVGVLFLISYAMVLFPSRAYNIPPYLVMSAALLAAHKMQLLGRNTTRFLGTQVIIAITLVFLAGALHGAALHQSMHLVVVVILCFATLYVFFEGEIAELRKERDHLNEQTLDLRPVAELGENISGVVHDFKGDVAGIYALAQIEEISGNSRVAQKLKRYGDRLNRRTNAILYVATARDREEPEVVHLQELLENTTYYFWGVKNAVRHEVKCSIQGNSQAAVQACRSTLLVIFENILKNSIEATEGRPDREIRITVTEVEEESSMVQVTIWNSGWPLPFGDGEVVDVRRDGFFQRGRSGKSGGSGMGMMNVIRALERLGAEMTMQDVPDGVESQVIIPRITLESRQADQAGQGQENRNQPERTQASQSNRAD
ncbi:Signal transduction histidine kinase [Alkalispirochaeta americana]|uniref:Signal transduction histidine kinase n=1 Tax=Alkalispirochaeta americana TaxID=159291 RepID=A0A1N6TMX6_9SPIO|nr:ATP-binding protein [Alkalispirochaeta americana]SIQ54641.1 Signal transduction histidine kinase [Alkalispirochaeta americana]